MGMSWEGREIFNFVINWQAWNKTNLGIKIEGRFIARTLQVNFGISIGRHLVLD